MSDPLSLRNSGIRRSRRTISVPLISSPWMAALTNRRGPGRRPLITQAGTSTSPVVSRRATGMTTLARSPGGNHW